MSLRRPHDDLKILFLVLLLLVLGKTKFRSVLIFKISLDPETEVKILP